MRGRLDRIVIAKRARDAIPKIEFVFESQRILLLDVATPRMDADRLVRHTLHYRPIADKFGGETSEVDKARENGGREIDRVAVIDLVHCCSHASDAVIDMDEVAHLRAAAPNRKFGAAFIGDGSLADAGERIGVVLVFTVTGKRPVGDRFEAVALIGEPSEVLAS